MTDYTKTTNFASKDALPSGNANKIVKGTEINTEFDNIATAVTTKANIANPAFTGVVSFPDGSASNPSITNTGDTNAGLFFSAADTLAFSAGGTAQVVFADGVISPVTDSDVDLGTNSLRFKDAYVDSVTVTGNGAITGDLDVDGTIEFDALSGTGSVAITDILDEDDMASNSATALATQQSIKAYVIAQQDTVDSLSEVLALGNTTGDTDISVTDDTKVQFRDSAIYINSSADGQLDIVADTEIQIAATTVDINGAVALNGAVTGATNVTLSGELDAATGDFSGAVDIDGALDVAGTTNLDVVDIDGATQIDATVSVGVDDTGYDVKFFGATSGKSLLWDESADSLIVTGTTTMTGNSTVSGTLGVTGVLTATSLDISGDIDVDGTATMDGLTVDGDGLIQANTGAKLEIKSTDTFIDNGEVVGSLDFISADYNYPAQPIKGQIRTESVSSTGESAVFISTTETTNLRDRIKIDKGGDISFFEDSGSTAKFFWDSSAESLGIGRTPTVVESAYNSIQLGAGGMYLAGSSNLAAGQIGQNFYADTSGNLKYLGNDEAERITFNNGIITFDNASANTSGAGAALTFNERIRIDASGNLLAGTTDTTIYNNAANNATDNGMVYSATDSRLDVTRYTTNAAAAVASFNRTGNDGSILSFAKSGTTVGSIGTVGGYLGIANGDTGLLFRAPYDDILPYTSTGNTGVDAAIDIGDGSYRFKDLYLSGRVVVNGVTTSAHAWSSESNSTSSSAHLYFRNPNGFVGNIATSGTATAYNTSSDYRLKENVVSLTSATARLNQLAPKRFNFIVDADVTVDGFLAHEVADVVPEAITGTKDAMINEEYEVTPAVLDEEGNVTTKAVTGTRSVPNYQGIDQSKLVPLLVATIQELEARITQLENN